LFDIHNEATTLLIKNSINTSNRKLVEAYDKENAIVISPDAGSAKKVHLYSEYNDKIKEVVNCVKHRDLSNGNITLKVLEPERCKDRNCVIIDDLCDGGRTFLAIAEQIEPKHLTLIVTHGIFSYGTKQLEEKFDEIIISNSYITDPNSDKVKVIDMI
jgi:ribose-phosphate pyrophosphokinase